MSVTRRWNAHSAAPGSGGRRISRSCLSITSTWGNGHATTYRGLIRELHALGHSVLFLERDVPWYAPHRDLPQRDWCDIQLYADVDDLRARFAAAVRQADAVIVDSLYLGYTLDA